MLLPYVGDRTEHVEGRDGLPRRIYGADTTGKVEYRFNTLGFRSDPITDAPDLRIFTSGCSYTFGVALDLPEVWPERLALQIADATQVPRFKIELSNFAQGGASNDYIVRTILTQTGHVRPDLVAVLFTHSARAELLFDDGFKTIGPWALRYLEEPMDALDAEHRARVELSLDYYKCHPPIGSLAKAILHIVCVQSFLKARSIPHVVSSVEHAVFADPKLLQHPLLGPLAALIDWTSFCRASPMDAIVCVDKAADGMHPGPRSHQIFARAMFEMLRTFPQFTTPRVHP